MGCKRRLIILTFPKIIISSVLEVNVNVMGQKENQEQRVERDLESCGQENFLAFDLTEILWFCSLGGPKRNFRTENGKKT